MKVLAAAEEEAESGELLGAVYAGGDGADNADSAELLGPALMSTSRGGASRSASRGMRFINSDLNMLGLATE